MQVFEKGENWSTGGKTSQSTLENQQTQPTYDAEPGNRTLNLIKCRFLRRGENRSTRGKASQSRKENQQSLYSDEGLTLEELTSLALPGKKIHPHQLVCYQILVYKRRQNYAISVKGS